MKTLFAKVWDTHEILLRDDGTSLLWVDRHLVHEGSHHAFRKLGDRGLPVARPDLTFGVTDHYAPTRGAPASPAIAGMMVTLADNTARHGITHFGQGDPRQGIVHVIGPELGLTLPGLTVNCGDSHTSTHGAFGAIAFGIGATEVAHVLATQTIWQTRPPVMRLTISGALAPGVSAKDVALAWIATLGADGARGHAIEYAGDTVAAMDMEARMTLCNLSIEGGARCGMVAPDDTTFAYVKGRAYAPADWDNAVAYWRSLPSDPGAVFDKDIRLNAADIAPLVTWGTSPEDTLPITAKVPQPDTAHGRDALDYMGLTPGQPLDGVPVDQVFIGSCTNGRISDLRAAANVLRGATAKVPGVVSPGSAAVKAQAEAEGLDRVFIDAGLDWVNTGCSLCVGMNGDTVAPGARCASTTNRNFKGRQGMGARTHLMSPAMVAAAAITGTLSDVRPLLQGCTP